MGASRTLRFTLTEGTRITVKQLRLDTPAASNILILVGEMSDSSSLLGLLESQLNIVHVKGCRIRRDTEIRHVGSVSEAVSVATSCRCAGIVLQHPELIGIPLVDSAGNRVKIVAESELIERVLGRVPVETVDPLTWSTQIAEQRSRGMYLGLKRVLDMAFAFLLGSLLLPIVALVAVIMNVRFGRPMIVGVPCFGRGGKVFRLWTFRTTESGDHARLENRRAEPAPGLRRILRQSQFDLVPALWNVLVGDLSVVGPRPEPVAQPGEKSAKLPPVKYLELMRPGLAGLAQVRFRYTDAPRDIRLALEYDLYYVKYANLGLDLRILLRGMWVAAANIVRLTLQLVAKVARTASRRMSHISPVMPSSAHAIGSVAFPRNREAGDISLKAALLVGSGSGGKLLAREMRDNPGWGYWPIGFVDDDLNKVATRVDGLPVLGTTWAIPAIVRREHVDAVVVTMPSASEVVIERIAQIARQTSAQVLTMPNLGDALTGRSGSLALKPIKVTDVLGREIVKPDMERCQSFIRGRKVLVSGAAGSIGREVARQVAQLQPEFLVGVDVNESDLFDLQIELKNLMPGVPFIPIVASITNRRRLDAIFSEFSPHIVFHAAAYKHVPMMEQYPLEAIWANALGSYEMAKASADYGVDRFVLVSTDKAVRPSSVMGATKRLAEIVTRAVADETGLSVCAVRFGNVLGSRGSVIPTFEKQIARGGPITITDVRMKRFFMTIPEAAGLIIQAGAFGDENVIYMLDMGEEVSIKELAERIIRLHGLRVGVDIDIVYSGIRPGEKLNEELSLEFESANLTSHSKIRILSEDRVPSFRSHSSDRIVKQLRVIAESGSSNDLRVGLLDLVSDFDGTRYEPETFVPTLVPPMPIVARSA